MRSHEPLPFLYRGQARGFSANYRQSAFNAIAGSCTAPASGVSLVSQGTESVGLAVGRSQVLAMDFPQVSGRCGQ